MCNGTYTCYCFSCQRKMTDANLNFKVLLYSNVKNSEEESSNDQFFWFLPNSTPPKEVNLEFISFLTSRDFKMKPLTFEERLQKFTLFEGKAQVFIFALVAGLELEENQGYMPGLYSNLKCLATVFSYTDLLHLPMLIACARDKIIFFHQRCH